MTFRSEGVQNVAKRFQKLTRGQMRKMHTGDRVFEHGVMFERLANGDGLFSVNFMVDRRRVHRTIGRESEGATRTTAEEFISKTRHEAREGRLALQLHFLEMSATRFGLMSAPP
jgi:hypothetical protein